MQWLQAISAYLSRNLGPMVVLVFCSGCFQGDQTVSTRAVTGDLPGVYLGMSEGSLFAARPKARSESAGTTERLQSGADVSYIFADELQPEEASGTRGLVAVLVEFDQPDADTVLWDSIVRDVMQRWKPLHASDQAPIRRYVQKFSSSPAILTRAQFWTAPETTVTLYEELEAPKNSRRRGRLLRLIVQSRSFAPSAFLPEEYRDVMKR